MVEITFKPAEEVVILEEIKYDNPKDLFKDLTSGAPPGASMTVLWAKGIVFQHKGLPLDVETIAKQRIEGKVYWSSVKYASMPEFRESESVGRTTVGIVKTESSALKEVARKLKERT